MQEIFLSYSRDDQAIARRFATAFERAGLGVWWDQALRPGEAFDEVTEKALNEAKAVVVLWSKKSVTSRWVRAEATQAHDNRTLIPVMIEACKRPIMFELTHTADLSQWNGDADDPAWRAFLGNVRQFVGDDAPGAPAPAAAQPDATRPGRGANVIILAAVALLVAGVALWAVTRTPGLGTSPVAPTSQPAASKQVTLAVLPFTNLSDDPRQEYFSDGLAEEILNQLAQVSGLLLTARTSSFSFKGKNEDARVIGKQLGVDNLLEGSVRKDGEQLRITAQLVNSRNGGQLWSQTYARRMSDIFAVQEDIAKDVARALSVKLDVGDTSRARGGTTNVAAYEKYLQGIALTGQIGTAPRLEAIRVLREAVELDPSFPLAWFYLYSNLQLVGGASAEHAYLLGKDSELAEARVEALSPEAWWTKALLAYKLFGQRKWAEADAATRESEAAATGSALPCQPYTSLLLGRAAEAVACAERLRRADPLKLDTSVDLQSALDDAGHPVEAQAEYERSRDLAGDHSRSDLAALSRLLALKGTNDAAVKAQYRRVLQSNTDPFVQTLFNTLQDAKDGRATIRQAFADPGSQSAAHAFLVAMLADRYGDRDLALSALRRGLLELHSKYSYSPWWYWKTGLRTDPRFKDILRGMGLADYFRASGNWGDFCKPVGSDDFECH